MAPAQEQPRSATWDWWRRSRLPNVTILIDVRDWREPQHSRGFRGEWLNDNRTPPAGFAGRRCSHGCSRCLAATRGPGFVALELGTDIGGSLRCPAHFCGVFAHKPTLDLVPMHGAGLPHVPNVPLRNALAVAGPMARSAADLALELDVIAGPDETAEGIGYMLALPPARHHDLKSFRVLVVDAHPLCPTAASVRTALDHLADNLGRIGADITRASPLLPDLGELARRHIELIAAGRSADLPANVYQRVEDAAKALPDNADWSVAARLHGLVASHRDWVLANRSLGRPRQQTRELFK